MSQILYNYPGMKEVVGQMQTQATSLDALGGNAGCLDTLSYVPAFTSFNGWEP